MKATARKTARAKARPPAAGVRKTARLFTNGASQAVRLPKEFRMQGTEVRIWKEGDRVVMEPVDSDWDAWWQVLQSFPKDFMIERNQPPMQERDWSAFDAPFSKTAKLVIRKARKR